MTVTVLVGCPPPPPGVAAARRARVDATATRVNNMFYDEEKSVSVLGVSLTEEMNAIHPAYLYAFARLCTALYTPNTVVAQKEFPGAEGGIAGIGNRNRICALANVHACETRKELQPECGQSATSIGHETTSLRLFCGVKAMRRVSFLGSHFTAYLAAF